MGQRPTLRQTRDCTRERYRFKARQEKHRSDWIYFFFFFFLTGVTRVWVGALLGSHIGGVVHRLPLGAARAQRGKSEKKFCFCLFAFLMHF